jgi:hypothetical protein
MIHAKDQTPEDTDHFYRFYAKALEGLQYRSVCDQQQ